MATVKFTYGKKNANIRIIFSFGTRNRITGTTKLPAPDDYETIKKDLTTKPAASAHAINTASKLRGLKNAILNSYIIADTDGIEITAEWLREVVRKHFNRQTSEQKNFNVFVNYLDLYIAQKEKRKTVGPSTIQKFKYLRSRILEFEKSNSKFTFQNMNSDKIEEFTDWLQEDYSLMISTTNRIRKNIRTVVLDADKQAYKLGIEIPAEARKIVMEKITDAQDKIYLDFDELNMIKKANIVGNELTLARDWLIIGCYTGQRVSDLLRMTKNMISTKYTDKGSPYNCIELVQKKTQNKEKREIAIPIHHEVQTILDKYEGEFPPVYSTNASSNETLFNRHLKKVCEIAGIHSMVRAKVKTEFTVGSETKTKNIIQQIEKCYVIASHVCRRSFATNFYGDKRFTTPQLLAITGHKTEQMFLQYVGKMSIDHASQTAATFMQIAQENAM